MSSKPHFCYLQGSVPINRWWNVKFLCFEYFHLPTRLCAVSPAWAQQMWAHRWGPSLVPLVFNQCTASYFPLVHWTHSQPPLRYLEHKALHPPSVWDASSLPAVLLLSPSLCDGHCQVPHSFVHLCGWGEDTRFSKSMMELKHLLRNFMYMLTGKLNHNI